MRDYLVVESQGKKKAKGKAQHRLVLTVTGWAMGFYDRDMRISNSTYVETTPPCLCGYVSLLLQF